jgi:hypothetical protein
MSTELSRPQDNTGLAVPEYLQEMQVAGRRPQGLEGLKDYWVPPRLKIVQAMTDAQLKATFGEGAIIVTPQNTPVSVPSEGSPAFTFIPIMSFTEFMAVNPRVPNLNFVRERTSDPNHPIAKRARNWKDKDARTESCPEAPSKSIRYCEFLNFLCIVEVEGLVHSPVLFSFWSSGSADGRKLANLILAKNVDMFAQRFEGKATPRSKDGNNWFGLSVSTPTQAPAFVQSPEEYARYRGMHEQFRKMRESGTIQTEHDFDDGGEVPEIIETSAVHSADAEF